MLKRSGGGDSEPVTAEMRATAAETADACAAEMSPAKVAAAKMAATSKMTTAAEMTATAEVAATAAMTTASAASSGCIDRARKRERKNNHGQEFELRHDNLLKPPGLGQCLASKPSLVPQEAARSALPSRQGA